MKKLCQNKSIKQCFSSILNILSNLFRSDFFIVNNINSEVVFENFKAFVAGKSAKLIAGKF